MPIHELAALGAATCWAFTGLIAAGPSGHLGAPAFNRVRQVFVTGLLALYVIFTGSWRQLDEASVGPLLLSGLIGIFIGDTLLFAALNRLGPRRAGILFALTGQQAAQGATFHIQTPHTMSHGELARILAELDHPVRLVAPEHFAQTVVSLGADPRLTEDVGRMLPMLEPPAGRAVRLDDARTRRWLDRLGVGYPAVDRDYIARFLAHGVTLGYFPAPAGALSPGEDR